MKPTLLETIEEHRQEILASRGGRPIDVDPIEMIEETEGRARP